MLGGGGSLNVMIQKAVKLGKVTDAVKKEFDATAAKQTFREAWPLMLRQRSKNFGKFVFHLSI